MNSVWIRKGLTAWLIVLWFIELVFVCLCLCTCICVYAVYACGMCVCVCVCVSSCIPLCRRVYMCLLTWWEKKNNGFV